MLGGGNAIGGGTEMSGAGNAVVGGGKGIIGGGKVRSGRVCLGKYLAELAVPNDPNSLFSTLDTFATVHENAGPGLFVPEMNPVTTVDLSGS